VYLDLTVNSKIFECWSYRYPIQLYFEDVRYSVPLKKKKPPKQKKEKVRGAAAA
jgi:hypothetical protein